MEWRPSSPPEEQLPREQVIEDMTLVRSLDEYFGRSKSLHTREDKHGNQLTFYMDDPVDRDDYWSHIVRGAELWHEQDTIRASLILRSDGSVAVYKLYNWKSTIIGDDVKEHVKEIGMLRTDTAVTMNEYGMKDYVSVRPQAILTLLQEIKYFTQFTGNIRSLSLRPSLGNWTKQHFDSDFDLQIRPEKKGDIHEEEFEKAKKIIEMLKY